MPLAFSEPGAWLQHLGTATDDLALPMASGLSLQGSENKSVLSPYNKDQGGEVLRQVGLFL